MRQMRIKDTAKEILQKQLINGQSDNWLWDRCSRVARNVEFICKLPELEDPQAAVDNWSLKTAVYFADAGFAICSSQTGSQAVIYDSLVDLGGTQELLELTRSVLFDRLTGHVNNAELEKVFKIISESYKRQTPLQEAKILSDARSLEDLGIIGMVTQIRRLVIQGKCISELLAGWKRKRDYQYWPARIEEGFHYQSVKNIAVQRYKYMENFITQLNIENNAKDIDEILLEDIT
jgi:hypothetical protein